MYFWRIDDLVGELRTRAVTATEALGYIIAFFVPNLLIGALPTDGTRMTALDAARQVGLTLVVLGGVWVAYRANGGSSGRDFAGRLLAVGWVVGFRLWAMATITLLVAAIVALAIGGIGSPDAGVLRTVTWWLLLSWAVLFWWRVAHHLTALGRVDGT